MRKKTDFMEACRDMENMCDMFQSAYESGCCSRLITEGKKTSRCGRIERKIHESVLSPDIKPLVYNFKKFMLHESNK